MINHRENEIIVVEGLKEYLSTKSRPCEVVRQNQVAKAPPYPYVSYTMTTPISTSGGSYSEANDGTLYRAALQRWSFTVQSNDQDESLELATRAYDFFTAAGLTLLECNGITIRRVSDVTVRDNLITIQYEYRNGLDVTFGLLTKIEPCAQPYRGSIETNTFNFKEE